MLNVRENKPAGMLHTSALKVTAVVERHLNRRGERGRGAAAAAGGLWLGTAGSPERLRENEISGYDSREVNGEPCPAQAGLLELKIIVSWIPDQFWCSDFFSKKP